MAQDDSELVRAAERRIRQIFEAAEYAVSEAVGERPGEVVRIEVLDSGPGVDPADRERIFEPRVTTKKGGPGRPLGTGMGLAIARKYAHAIGGRIEMDPAQPQTCFVLKLVAGGMDRG